MSLISSDLNQAIDKGSMISVKTDKPRTGQSLSEIKNGKIIFRQKPISFESLSETMQEIVSFRNCMSSLDTPMAKIPENYLPLIAKLVHESDKSATTLSKHLQALLVPPTLDLSLQSPDSEDRNSLAISVIEQAIRAVAERTNYGITTDLEKHPAALCVWRWEVNNKDWLPSSVRDKIYERLQERVAAKKHLQSIFDGLSEDEKNAILHTGKNTKPSKGKETSVDPTGTADSSDVKQDKDGEASEVRESSVRKLPRAKKPVDPETIAKEKERLEKKAIKAEKEKKEVEAKKKSAAVFVNFFKAGSSTKAKKPSLFSQNPASGSGSSSIVSSNEFQRTFKPFVAKKDAELAPINWFLSHTRNQSNARNKTHTQQAILDKEGQAHVPVEDLNMDIPSREVIRLFLESKPPSLHLISQPLLARRRFKNEHLYCVRTIMRQLNEAEVQDDHRGVRKLTALLKNRRKVPAKIFFFAENNRPGYLGTWTRCSKTISPRRPFARDLLAFDYDHDSDAEWEEDETGEDVDSPDDNAEEDDMSSTASDLDDWLVDGDEVELEPTSTDEPPPAFDPNLKRKAVGPHETQNKRRKVVPLVPFQKGPVWEKKIGVCDYEPFVSMRIQLLNDTPFPLDPFTFVSAPVTPERTIKPPSKDPGGVFAIPALPDRALPTVPDLVDPSTDESRVKRRAANLAPKTNFPDSHVPLLLQKIHDSTTGSIAVLVDSLFQEMKPLGIKKNALEVKLREVAEKDKAKKGWIVRERTWAQYGLPKPS